MNGIDQLPGVLLDEEEKQLGCQLLNKTNEVADISTEFLEMEYLTLIPPEKGSPKRRVRNETLPPPEEGKEKKFTSPSLLYIITLIIQRNPFSFNCSIMKKPSEFTESPITIF